MVSPSAFEIMSMDFSNDSGEYNNAQDNDQSSVGSADVLKITPSVVIGKIVGGLFPARSDT